MFEMRLDSRTHFRFLAETLSLTARSATETRYLATASAKAEPDMSRQDAAIAIALSVNGVAMMFRLSVRTKQRIVKGLKDQLRVPQ